MSDWDARMMIMWNFVLGLDDKEGLWWCEKHNMFLVWCKHGGMRDRYFVLEDILSYLETYGGES